MYLVASLAIKGKHRVMEAQHGSAVRDGDGGAAHGSYGCAKARLHVDCDA